MKSKYDLIIIGGGIMGLFTAYFASRLSKRVILLEGKKIQNQHASSTGYTRSIRNDYIDPYYANFAAESRYYWGELEKNSRSKFIIDCGVLNIVKKSITPDLEKSYAYRSYRMLKAAKFETKKFNRQELMALYPQFEADLGTIDIDAGLLHIPQLITALVGQIKQNGVKIFENQEVRKIIQNGSSILVSTKSNDSFLSRNVVLTAGPWTNRLISCISRYKGGYMPIIPVPQTVRFFRPEKSISNFNPEKFPVFAYLDIGIYGHPMYNTPGVKIAHFEPGENEHAKIKNQMHKINKFIENCIPALINSHMVEERSCYYSVTPDNDFIVGSLPNTKNIYIGAGFCGTGFKFAPVIGKALAELSIRGNTVYDIGKFDPFRFGETGKSYKDKGL